MIDVSKWIRVNQEARLKTARINHEIAKHITTGGSLWEILAQHSEGFRFLEDDLPAAGEDRERDSGELLQHIRTGMDAERKRVLAEDRIALSKLSNQLGGGEVLPTEEPGEMVGDVNLGDQHTYHVPSQNKYLGAAVLAGALSVPLAAVAWKYLDRAPAPVIEDTDTRTGLRIYRP